MEKLILQPTEISQWYALVHEAEISTQRILNECSESYLVYLLMRFSNKTQWLESVIAFDFLNAVKQSKLRKIEMLREAGDKSLLFCGLFPEIALKRHVDLTYFVNLGRAAYFHAGDLEEPSLSVLYHQLGRQFIDLQKILQSLRRNAAHDS